MNPLNPKKLLLTKWTAVKPLAKQKHFLVSRVIQPDDPTAPIESVEIEAVFSKAVQVIAWRELQDEACGGRVGFDPEKYFCIACHPSGRDFKNRPNFEANTLISGVFHTFQPVP